MKKKVSKIEWRENAVESGKLCQGRDFLIFSGVYFIHY